MSTFNAQHIMGNFLVTFCLDNVLQIALHAYMVLYMNL